MPANDATVVLRVSVSGLLAWIIPGLGHIYLGLRIRGLVLLVTITATFWTGVAIGGVRETVDPQEKKLWFIAQIFNGGNTLSAYALSQSIARTAAGSGSPAPMGHWLSADVGVHYTGVAGLLNLLVILDAVGCAETSRGSRRHRRELQEVVP